MPVATNFIEAKQFVHSAFSRLAQTDTDNLHATLGEIYGPDAVVRCSHPINELSGHEEIAGSLWRPLRESFQDLERRDLILVAGEFEDHPTVGVMGHYQATFSKDWLDIPASHGVVHIRYGEVHQFRQGRIAKSHVLIDLLDLMHQVGCWPIAPSVGAEGMWPGPATNDGVLPDGVDVAGGKRTMDLILLMHKGLLQFDGKDLESMDHARYWSPNFMWYGPSGIGATRGLEGFELHHQIPFLRAFPDRRIGKRIVSIADGNFAVTGGWPSVIATHTGADWLGLSPTGREVNMRVMDFYRVDGAVIAENWVPIDIIDILLQLGVDVLDRVRHLHGRPRRTL